ncbi:MAG: 3',5'-cyclic-nucleotide phosphodiesterase, partial [bacterium]
MKIRVLGSSGSELPEHNLPAFLIDGVLLMDAGTIGVSLDTRKQERIRHILVSHAHLDHIKGIPFLLDNIIVRNRKHTVTVLSGKEVISDLKQNVLNGRIWPDFTRIPDREQPVLRYGVLDPAQPVKLDGYLIECERVSHAVPAYGYIVTGSNGRAVAYTGDTGPTDLFWKKMAKHRVTCLIIEVSFPNSMNDLAAKSGHLTAGLLKQELGK